MKIKNEFFKRMLCAAVSVVCLSGLGMTQTGGPIKPTENMLSLDERLGTDDGAALAILFGANMRGNLDLCDCNYPRGGLARRIGYVEAFKRKFRDTPVVQVEGGFLFFGSMGYPMADLSNEQTTRAYSRFLPDVINLGREDLPYAQKLFAREGLTERAQKFPMIKNTISANGVFSPDTVPPPGFLIREVSGPRIYGGKKKLRIGFVGVAAPTNPGGGLRDATVRNMFETATQGVLAVRKDCDVLVIVAHCDLQDALRLASENLEADVVIAADAGGLYNPRRVGNTLVVTAAPGNTQESDLRLYISGDGQFTYKFRANDLDKLVPEDPAAAAFAEAARVERNGILK